MPTHISLMIFAHQNRFGETRLTPGSMRTQQYRLVNRDKRYELYDMIADPGQKQDISDRQPKVTRRLASAYEAWYHDVTSAGVEPPPLPVGYQATDMVAFQAEDSQLHGGLKFRRKQGWAHDSILNWKSSDASVAWSLDVLRSGRYEVTLMYGCSSEDVGATIQIAVGGRHAKATIRHAHYPMPAERNTRDRKQVWTSGPVRTMTLVPLSFEPIAIEKGQARLVIRTVDLPAEGAFELKEARLRRVE